jgi:hypothetical protein
MDGRDQQDCESDIRKIKELLSCGIFEQQNAGNILRSAAFIELIICLRDLLHKTEKYAKRITFTDDVMTNEYVHDITDAVTAIRDACCHIDSFKRKFDERIRGAFIVVYGKISVGHVGDLHLKSDYADDIAFFYGKNRLYMKRHIIRAFQEAHALLVPLF